jgi:RNA polymerase sigma-70 factor (ECF subfamily)
MDDTIRDFIKGDKKAFDWVYKNYSPVLFGICLRYTSCRDDAQEVLQMAFIKAYENRKKMDPSRPLGPWLKTITINTAINFLKTNKKMVLKAEDNFFDSVDFQQNEQEDDLDLKKRLLRILNEIPDGYRTVFNLFVLDNLTHQEIATHLNISVGTSKSQLAKAKSFIKNKVEKERNDERVG